ncbi:MAG: hybrid sensor histidine kinase/response regulator [Deltaproteobacteria bacterium]|nr:hybrid sensor histidine kinase/response regulator [Deltaproteobacteria bacterium]
MIEDNELLSDFIEESKENLAIAEEDFLSLESQGKSADPSTINRAFRCVHSIKGGAGFLGMVKIGELAHAMEAMMDLVRQNKLQPDKKNITMMLKGVDHLNSMFDNSVQSNDYNIDEIHTNILKTVAIAVSGKRGQEQLDKLQLKKEEKKATQKKTTKKKSSPAKSKKKTEPVETNEPADDSTAEDPMVHLRIISECLSALKKDPEAGQNWISHAIEGLQSIKNSAKDKDLNNVFAMAEAIDETLGEIYTDRIEVEDMVIVACEDGLDTLQLLFDDIENSNEIDILDSYQQMVSVCKNFEGDPGIIGAFEEEDTKTIEIKSSDVISQSEESTDTTVVSPMETASTDLVQTPQRVKNNESAGAKSETKSEVESIRVKVSLLNHLMSLAGEMVLVRNQQLQLVDQSDSAMRNNTQKLDMVTSELQECVMKTRMQPVGILFNKFNRIVRDLGNKLGKNINLVIIGGDVELDKSILESLSDPLTHMIRNACDHGIEAPNIRKANNKSENGQIDLRAWHEGGQVHIEVRDDGKGINPGYIKKKVVEKGLRSEQDLVSLSHKEILNLVLLPGFTTAEQVSDVSGRGVGMDVVTSNIEKIGGTLDLDSVTGKGSAVRLQLPLTLAIIPCLIIRVKEHNYAIPQINLEELVTLYNQDVDEKIENARGREVFRLRDQLLPMLRLGEILSKNESFTDEDLAAVSIKYREKQKQAYQEFQEKKANSKWGDEKFRQSLTFAVLKVGSTKYGLIVDEVLGTEEIVVKSMHPYLKNLNCYAGATVMGDGRVSLILDVLGVAQHGNASIDNTKEQVNDVKGAETSDAKQSILLFKYGRKELFAVSLNMISRIEKIEKSMIEEVGEKEFIAIDEVSTQILRLDHLLNVSEFDDSNETYLLLPKMANKPFGILISKIEDSLDCIVDLNTESYIEPGLLGTSLINDKMTLFLDTYQLIELANPELNAQLTGGSESAIFSDEKEQNLNGNKKVLLVEDVMFFRTLVKGYLKSEGYEVITAENGKVALEEFKRQEFDLIVSDIEMPVMDGFEFMSAVRNILNNTTIPALALTALESDKDIKKIQAAGFDVYEAKIDKEKLISTVTNLLNQ